MSFADPDTHRHRTNHGRIGYTTFEVGHDSTRQGIVVQVDGCRSAVVARHILERAFDLAGEQTVLRVADPGWWALMIGWAALQTTGCASVQRVLVPGELHVCVVVERERMLEEHPLWPLARFGPTGRWTDCRGEAALLRGPADAELKAYAEAAGIDAEWPTLRRMFDQGVLEWAPELPEGGGRRQVQHAR